MPDLGRAAGTSDSRDCVKDLRSARSNCQKNPSHGGGRAWRMRAGWGVSSSGYRQMKTAACITQTARAIHRFQAYFGSGPISMTIWRPSRGFACKHTPKRQTFGTNDESGLHPTDRRRNSSLSGLFRQWSDQHDHLATFPWVCLQTHSQAADVWHKRRERPASHRPPTQFIAFRPISAVVRSA